MASRRRPLAPVLRRPAVRARLGRPRAGGQGMAGPGRGTRPRGRPSPPWGHCRACSAGPAPIALKPAGAASDAGAAQGLSEMPSPGRLPAAAARAARLPRVRAEVTLADADRARRQPGRLVPGDPGDGLRGREPAHGRRPKPPALARRADAGELLRTQGSTSRSLLQACAPITGPASTCFPGSTIRVPRFPRPVCAWPTAAPVAVEARAPFGRPAQALRRAAGRESPGRDPVPRVAERQKPWSPTSPRTKPSNERRTGPRPTAAARGERPCTRPAHPPPRPRRPRRHRPRRSRRARGAGRPQQRQGSPAGSRRPARSLRAASS